MTQRELERELADVTGESMDTIRNLGFSLVEVPDPEPQTIDWDEHYATERVGMFPMREHRQLAA